MSLFEHVYEQVNPELELRMNDVILLMVASFFVGRFYQQRLMHIPHFTYSAQHNSMKWPHFYNQGSVVMKLKMENPAQHPEQTLKIQDEQNKSGAVENIPQDSCSQKEQVNATTEQKVEQFESENDILLEKIKLEGYKIQQKGTFEMYFQKNSQNPNFVRKIEKHEIISDYILRSSIEDIVREKAIVPVKTGQILPDYNSVLEIEYFRNYKSKNKRQAIENRIINRLDRSPGFSQPVFQNGKFKKFFKQALVIGKGGFGTVVEAVHLMEGQKYALKKIYLRSSQQSIEFQRLLNQIKILSSVSHPNIVQYHTCWVEYADLSEVDGYHRHVQLSISQQQSSLKQRQEQENVSYMSSNSSGFGFLKKSKSEEKPKANNRPVVPIEAQNNCIGFLPVVYIQMELCENTLAYYIRKTKIVDADFCFSIMQQLINGVEFLHSQGIVHRDLKPENIFINWKERKADQETQMVLEKLKIGDFGLSLLMNGEMHRLQIGRSKAVGTPSYIAPELYNAKIGSVDLYRVDVFALGVIYYQLLNRFETTHERGQKLTALKRGKVCGLSAKLHNEKQLIKQMVKPENRPYLSEIKKMEKYYSLQESRKSSKQNSLARSFSTC